VTPFLSLAPLHGVTNRTYRSAYFAHFRGFDEAFAPFILAVPTARMKGSHFKDFVPDPTLGVPLVPQLLGADPEGFLDCARAISGMGYGEVNWNLGCPYPMVAKKGRGSGLLPHPDRIERFLESVCPHLDIELSVKLRLGRHESAEILALMPILNRYPIKRVIIHPRVGVQMYRGAVDLEGFARAASLSAHPVFYNGDIGDSLTLSELAGMFPSVTGWMIGRSALRDPFLPARIKGLELPADEAGTIRAFHDTLFASYREILCGPAHALDKMKEVWTYLGLSFPRAMREREAIARAKDLDSYSRAVDSLFLHSEKQFAML
jgi:tRNA-dihydrouridine synthase